jgi:peptidoglycan/LPS O-acetylase OafA/YrhL
MKKVSETMTARGNTSGFDYLRLLLAVSVLCIHSFAASYGRPGEAILFDRPLRGLVVLVLPMFFALSGFLVAGSYYRTRDLKKFVALRVLRIVPALSVEVILCALILGPIFTNQTLTQYFSDPLFASYFGNMIGWIHYLLPGVFSENPFNIAVNTSLWTVPYELECYLAIILLAVAGLLMRRGPLAIIIALAPIGIWLLGKYAGGGVAPDGFLPARLLILNFLCGVVIYTYRDKLPTSGLLTTAAIVFAWIMLSFTATAYVSSFVVAYATVGLGLLNPKRLSIIESGDYSYGIYLYAFPIQQTYSFLFPAHRVWYLNILFALPIASLFAAFSWHAIEKHFLKLRNKLSMFRYKESHFTHAR